MKTKTLINTLFILGVIIALLAALPLRVTAGISHARYKLIDIGTLGGPTSYGSVNGPGFQILNNSGTISTSADTSTPDPNASNPNNCYNPDCFLSHAIRWKNGVLTDLGALPGLNGSAAGAINARGWSAGQSQNGEFDPASGLPETRAVLWTNDQIIDLGTFGGNWSLVTTLNNKGQVVGFATNAIPDPFTMFFGATQTRAFLWQNGVLQDLGTLGGPDAEAFSINSKGQVAGFAYTNATPNETTGIPTVHPFVWDHGKMIDLGTLGGTYGGVGSCSFSVLSCNSPVAEGSLIINDRGLVIGSSNLAGDQTHHPFLWDRGTLTDLGTLGGDNGDPTWINDAGEVVGDADLPGSQIHHAFLWRKGTMTDLGTLGSTSFATAINSRGQVVGRSRISSPTSALQHAFLWENGGPMVDLNTLISPNSRVVLLEADNINERGEIVGVGLPAGCDNRSLCGHLFLLIPCQDGDKSCGH